MKVLSVEMMTVRESRTADPVKKRDSLFETLKAKFSVHIGNNDWEGVDNSTTVDGGVHVEL